MFKDGGSFSPIPEPGPADWLRALQYINRRLIDIHAESGPTSPLNLEEPLDFENIYFNSTCLKADIHFPVDWILLRDLTRTLMKATVIIRREGLKHRMPQEPLGFLSDINTLVMKMTATNRVKDGRKKRKTILKQVNPAINIIVRGKSNA